MASFLAPVAVLLLVSAGPAEAAGGAGAESSRGQRTVSAAFVVARDPTVANRTAPEMAYYLRRFLSRQEGVVLQDLSRVLDAGADEKRYEALEGARRALAEGKRLYNELDVSRGLERLLEAERLFAAAEGTSGVEDGLVDALLHLGACQVLLGRRQAGAEAFGRALRLRPGLEPDPDTFPPSLLEVFRASKENLRRLPTGSVEVISEPPGSEVWTNGRFVGISPVVVEGLPAGEVFIRVTRDGYVPALVRPTVKAGRVVTSRVSLRETRRFLLLSQFLPGLNGAGGQPGLPAAARALKDLLYLDQLLLLEVEGSGPEHGCVLSLFDFRLGRRVAGSRGALLWAGEGRGERLERFVRAVYSEVRPGALLAGQEGSAGASEDKAGVRTPLHQTWWFWTGIGAVVLGGVATGVILGWPEDAGLERRDGTGTVVIRF